MKKQLMVIGIVAILVTVGLCRCTDNTKINKEKILGRWIGTSSVSNQTPIFTFYANGSIFVIFDEVSS